LGFWICLGFRVLNLGFGGAVADINDRKSYSDFEKEINLE